MVVAAASCNTETLDYFATWMLALVFTFKMIARKPHIILKSMWLRVVCRRRLVLLR